MHAFSRARTRLGAENFPEMCARVRACTPFGCDVRCTSAQSYFAKNLLFSNKKTFFYISVKKCASAGARAGACDAHYDFWAICVWAKIAAH